VNPRTTLAVPDATPLRDALEHCAALQSLQQRLAESRARLDAIRAELPAPLVPLVLAGPADATGWTLLAANASAAAKLRQLQPHLEAALRQRGWEVSSIRIRIQSSTAR
jgi:hypothetical protein